MRKFRTIYILALILCGFVLAGCSSTADDNAASNATNANVSAENSNTAKDNIEELGMVVRLPLEPKDVVWKEHPADEKTGAPQRLTAVLRFSDENAARLAAQAAAHRPPAPTKFSAEEWFPAEVISQAEISGEANVSGVAYAANDLFLPPYNAGTLTRIENSDYFVLELTAQ